MNGAVIGVLIVGFFVLVVGLLVYSVVIDQPRLRRQLQQQSEQHGWTYTPGKSLVVVRYTSRGYLISPQETISESIQGTSQGIQWRINAVTVTSKVASHLA